MRPEPNYELSAIVTPVPQGEKLRLGVTRPTACPRFKILSVSRSPAPEDGFSELRRLSLRGREPSPGSFWVSASNFAPPRLATPTSLTCRLRCSAPEAEQLQDSIPELAGKEERRRLPSARPIRAREPRVPLTNWLEHWPIALVYQVLTGFPAQLLPWTNGKQVPGSVPPWGESHGPIEDGG